MKNGKDEFKYDLSKDAYIDFGKVYAKSLWKGRTFYFLLNTPALFEFVIIHIKVACNFSEEHWDVKNPEIDPRFGIQEPGSKMVVIGRIGNPSKRKLFRYKPKKWKDEPIIKWKKGFNYGTMKYMDGLSLGGNYTGLLSIATHLIDLAQPEVPIGIEIKYSNKSGLSAGSIPFVVKKIASLE